MSFDLGYYSKMAFSVQKIIHQLSRIEKILGLQTDIKWRNVLAFAFFHFFGLYWGILYAFPVKWQTIVYAISSVICNGSGITIGVHRLWTHRTFKASLPVKIYLMLAFAGTGQNSIYDWVRDHRLHHKFSDTDADPHNVKRGFFFSHIGWLMMKKNNLVREKGKLIDMSDIEADPVAMFERKYSIELSLLMCYILPTVTGIIFFGETWKTAVAWHLFIRFLLILHSEMTVNSLAHMFGYKPFSKTIEPTQNAFVSFVTGGEGWHNYHHIFPYDYKAAETFDFLNMSTFVIRLWAKLGLVSDLREPSSELVRAVINRQGDEKVYTVNKPLPNLFDGMLVVKTRALGH